MPSASSNSNMNNLVHRETYQANGLVRSQQAQQQQPHQQSINLSQTSLQKLPTSSPPQFLYSNGNNNTSSNNKNNNTNVNSSNQPLNHMQFPPPPPMASLVPTQPTQVPKQQQLDPNQLCHSFSSLVVPQPQQQQPLSMPSMMSQTNGSNNLTQNPILMTPPSMINTKNAQQPQTYHHLQQQQQQLYQIQPQQQQQLIQYPTNFIAGQQQQQVPMTTIMIPATAAAQIQSASVQIQQAAMQAMAQNPNQPQILVFMIPYMMPQQQQQQPPTIPPTPEQVSLNSTLVRHSQSTNSLLRSSQHQSHQNQNQQQQQPLATTSTIHSRAVSSLSHNSKQEPEKFYIKANFTFQSSRNKMELSFQKGDILHVLDTLQNSDYGLQYWLATRVKTNGKDAEKGLIPDRNKAEEIALEQRTLNIGEPGSHLESGSSGVLSASVGRVNFLKRRSAQRSKSLCKDNWDNVVFDIGSFKLPVYERVIYKHPGFCRPVVIFGPLADVAREKLLKDYPEKYSYPTGFHQSQDHPRVIRLKGILEVVDQGKHALLDITPSAVEKLNYVNLAPIVIFMKTDSKSIIKEFRARAAKSLDPNARDEDTLRRDGKSSRKLLEQSIKLEKTWHHVFTATLNLSTMGSEMWYRKLRETIENQQSVNVWMGERKSDKKSNNIANNNSLTSSSNEMVFPVSSNSNSNTQSSTTACMDSSSVLSERLSESLNIASKSTIDLLPDGTYGNRSQLRNAYAHSLAQKLARASSEPKLNGLSSDQDDVDDDDEEEDDDDDDEDNDDCIKKPFPEFENSSSVSSSNGAPSYGQGSMSGSNLMTYQHYPPPQPKQMDHHSSASLNRVHEAIYSRNPSSSIVNSNISNNANTTNVNSGPYSNGGGAGSSNNYHPLPPMVQGGSGGFQNQSMNNISNNNNGNTNHVIDLSRNHDTRGSAFQVYSDMNQNNYHYYNLNKI